MAMACKHWHESQNSMTMDPMADARGLYFECVHGLFNSLARVKVDGRDYCGNLSIYFLLSNLHSLVEEFLSDGWIGECGVVHCLHLLCYRLSCWGLS